MLWDEVSAARSKKYLRMALWRLRRDLGERIDAEWVSSDSRWIQLGAVSRMVVDTWLVERAFERGKLARPDSLVEEDVALIREAVSAYRGHLLEGEYGDWFLLERERYEQIYFSLADQLMLHAERSGAFQEGLGVGLELLRRSPDRERTHRILMRLYDRAGDRSSALRQFRRCRKVLHRELGVGPSERTRELHRRIRRGDRRFAASQDERSPGSEEDRSMRVVSEQLIKLQRVMDHVQANVREMRRDRSLE